MDLKESKEKCYWKLEERGLLFSSGRKFSNTVACKTTESRKYA